MSPRDRLALNIALFIAGGLVGTVLTGGYFIGRLEVIDPISWHDTWQLALQQHIDQQNHQPARP